ncbi:hypothetical protein ABT187_42680 [Streptomyces sp. NPDC001817]|uniref:hypothetical protein n=1 Tax=Streptomyces sp. NPDC001817 TaxID=3154398 RepID=UPI00331C9AA5
MPFFPLAGNLPEKARIAFFALLKHWDAELATLTDSLGYLFNRLEPRGCSRSFGARAGSRGSPSFVSGQRALLLPGGGALVEMLLVGTALDEVGFGQWRETEEQLTPAADRPDISPGHGTEPNDYYT